MHNFVGMTKCNHLRWMKILLMVALVTGAWNLCFCHSNVFRLLAVLHDAAGAVRSEFGESPGYC